MGMDTAALAKTLGVSESKLKTALEASRPTGGAQPGSGTSPVAAIAKALDLDEAKVQEAFAAQMPTGGPGGQGGTPPSGDAPGASADTADSSAS